MTCNDLYIIRCLDVMVTDLAGCSKDLITINALKATLNGDGKSQHFSLWGKKECK